MKNWILINMCRQPALYVQIGADLEVVKWFATATATATATS